VNPVNSSIFAISESSKPMGRMLLGSASVVVLVYASRVLKRVAATDASMMKLFAKMASLLVAMLTAFVVLLVFSVVFPKWAPVIAGALFLVHKFGPRFGRP
jgi:hypothetical protein